MATFLIYATKQQYRNSSGRNAVLASGANEAAARVAAKAARPDGETKVPAKWVALELTGADNLDAPIWIQGQVAEPLLPASGR